MLANNKANCTLFMFVINDCKPKLLKTVLSKVVNTLNIVESIIETATQTTVDKIINISEILRNFLFFLKMDVITKNNAKINIMNDIIAIILTKRKFKSALAKLKAFFSVLTDLNVFNVK